MARKKSFSGRDLGIDLGTANTLVHVRGRGVVLNEPSVVAVNAVTGDLISIGVHAKATIGRTPSHVVAVRPLRDGVIADFEMAERMLAHVIRKVTGGRRFTRPRVLVCVPSGITGVERRAVIEAATSAGAREVYVIEEPMAAAIGAGLPVAEATGSMVVDVGGGTTEVAVLSLGGIVAARSVRIAGDAIDAAITQYLKREHGILVGERTAEELKMAIGSASPAGYWPDGLQRLDQEFESATGAVPQAVADDDPELSLEVMGPEPADPEPIGNEPAGPEGTGPAGSDTGSAESGPVLDARPDRHATRGLQDGGGSIPESAPVDRCQVRGRDQVSGLPKTLDLDADELRRAIAEPVDAIVEAVRHTLDTCPPELAGDIVDRGIVLTGGGALLRGLDLRLSNELNIPVIVAEDPLHCVVAGTGICVENADVMRTVLDAASRTQATAWG